jgi:hypothetical protein
MRAILMPGSVLCGGCGGVMVVRRGVASAQATVYCTALSCAERRKRYTLDLPTQTIELQPEATPDEG